MRWIWWTAALELHIEYVKHLKHRNKNVAIHFLINSSLNYAFHIFKQLHISSSYIQIIACLYPLSGCWPFVSVWTISSEGSRPCSVVRLSNSKSRFWVLFFFKRRQSAVLRGRPVLMRRRYGLKADQSCFPTVSVYLHESSRLWLAHLWPKLITTTCSWHYFEAMLSF